MKKQTLLLLLVGTLCMSFSLLMQPFFEVPSNIGDFLKGFGVTMMVASVFVERKLNRG
jgi:hypothetical protein